jgi:hypothetical protein
MQRWISLVDVGPHGRCLSVALMNSDEGRRCAIRSHENQCQNLFFVTSLVVYYFVIFLYFAVIAVNPVADSEISELLDSVDRQLSILDTTLQQVDAFHRLVSERSNLHPVPLTDWCGLGAVQ